MKKNSYITPATKIITIDIQPLMFVSGDQMSISNEETVTETEDLLSRQRGSFWDEE